MLTVDRSTASMLTRDGVRLDADIYRPIADGPFPVLLMRQPYGRAIASTVVYAHPTWYAAQGYIVVIQDVRGRGTSEGEFRLFETEIADGYDSVVWAAQLPGSNGRVGMYGFSYQGMTQLYAAVQKPPGLTALCPAMLGGDLYQDWAYEGGAFCLQTNLAWALQLSAETARLQNDSDAFQVLASAAKNLSFQAAHPSRSPLLETLDPTSFYHQWLAQPQPEADYWRRLSPITYAAEMDVPMLHIGGWFDAYLRGTWWFYQTMAQHSTQRQHLIVGPWAHLPWGRQVGAVDFGPEAVSPCDRLQLRWFDHFLKGIDTGLLAQPPIAVFELGSHGWRYFDALPPDTLQTLYLQSAGLASTTYEGRLVETADRAIGGDTWVHDPWRPVPSVGGHAAIPAGCFNRAAIDDRTDVLTYTSAPLTADLHLFGTVTVQLDCTADHPSFDLCAVLSEVHPTGQVYNLCQGYLRVQARETTRPITVILQPTCARIAQGHALRLSLSAACFPAYDVNDGHGTAPGETRLIDQSVITLTLWHGADRASYLRLPVQTYPA